MAYDTTGRRRRTENLAGQVTTTAKRRVPEATNVASARSRYGMTLETVSLSAVTNATVYDVLGRVATTIDGRGNATGGTDIAGALRFLNGVQKRRASKW